MGSMYKRNHHIGTASGWSAAEDNLLLREIEQCKLAGKPLKAAFSFVSQATGRQPNSVRNHYYMMLKPHTANANCGPSAFLPFSSEEINMLLKEVLIAQSRGESVRACTLRIGNGDSKAMLRYQNKYRSLLKSNRALVENTVNQLRSEGFEIINPYDRVYVYRRANSLSRSDHIESIAYIAESLSKIDATNTEQLFRSISALASSVMKNASKAQLAHAASHSFPNKDAYDAGNAEAEVYRLRCKKLREMLNKLIRLNYEFLSQSEAKKFPSLTGYVDKLICSVHEGEELLVELQRSN